MNPFQGGWLILVSIVCAMILAVARLPFGPDWLAWLRPDWAVALLYFWGVTTPRRVGAMSAWILGLFFDVLLAGPLGLNGICLALATYIGKRHCERLSLFPVPQQFLVVLGIATVVQLVKRTALIFLLDVDWSLLAVVGPALTTALVYPPLARGMLVLATRFGVKGMLHTVAPR